MPQTAVCEKLRFHYTIQYIYHTQEAPQTWDGKVHATELALMMALIKNTLVTVTVTSVPWAFSRPKHPTHKRLGASTAHGLGPNPWWMIHQSVHKVQRLLKVIRCEPPAAPRGLSSNTNTHQPVTVVALDAF